MNRRGLIDNVQETLGSTKVAAQKAVDAVLAAVLTGLKRDKEVQLAGFGTFAVRERAARKGRNPKTGEEIWIPASKSVAFRASKALKGSV